MDINSYLRATNCLRSKDTLVIHDVPELGLISQTNCQNIKPKNPKLVEGLKAI